MNGKTSKILWRVLSLLLVATIFITAQAMPAMAETEQTAEIPETAELEGTAETDAIQSLRIAEGFPANPVHHCVKDDTDWSYVYFGSYPQTEVTGDALTPAMIGAPYDGNGDAWVDGIKYRRISKSDTNNSNYFGDAEYRYFKWEQIKWRVLKNDGSTLFLAADKGLDCKYYDETGISITWENCTLRSWLNREFYEAAFSSSEQKAIVAQDVVNEDNPYYKTEGGNDTRDNVYLLSIGEVTNPEYGFCEGASAYSASRRVQASDYAHARGDVKILAAITRETVGGGCGRRASIQITPRMSVTTATSTGGMVLLPTVVIACACQLCI